MNTNINIIIAIVVPFIFLSCSTSTGEDEFTVSRVYDEIYSMNLDGTGLTKLTAGKTGISLMRYLPLSDRILFVQNGTYLMKSDGSERRRLSTNVITDGVTITQDEQIAYFTKVEVDGLKVNSVLYSMSLSSGEVRQVLQDSSGIRGIAVSMDGLHIVFSTSHSASQTTMHSSSLHVLNTMTFASREIRMGFHSDYLYPQFIPNTNEVLFIEVIDSNRSIAYLRTMDVTDSSKSQLLDTVDGYRIYTSPSLNNNGDIFYLKDGITVLNVTAKQKIVFPYVYRTDYD
ncbi:MAG: hypothetical protein F9K22_14600 [Bacteroidetes bacterium]|nr:MAG: hypothetical protein F9K22_14600 [Bacteroidota bacterium]